MIFEINVYLCLQVFVIEKRPFKTPPRITLLPNLKHRFGVKMNFAYLILNVFFEILCRYCLTGSFYSYLIYNVHFPRGFTKMNSNNDDKHGHGQEKKRPSAYVEGNNDRDCYRRAIKGEVLQQKSWSNESCRGEQMEAARSYRSRRREEGPARNRASGLRIKSRQQDTIKAEDA